MDVIQDIPFASARHQAAGLTSLLTPLASLAFRGSAPLSLIDGPVCGVGKGLFADVVVLIVTSRRFLVMSDTNDRTELRK